MTVVGLSLLTVDAIMLAVDALDPAVTPCEFAHKLGNFGGGVFGGALGGGIGAQGMAISAAAAVPGDVGGAIIVAEIEGGLSTTNGGPYSHLSDPPGVAAGKSFPPTQKAQIYAENMAKNGGVLSSDDGGSPLVMPTRSQKGVTPSPNEAQIDHIIPANPADPSVFPGTNSYSNAQVLSRFQNRTKSNR